MNETSDAVRAAQQTRRRALVVPREHGAWGLLLVPLFTGVVAGFASEHRIWPLLTFTMAALSLFWLRTPVESLVGTGPLTANTEGERWTALVASVFLTAVATACLTGLMWKGRDLQLLLLGAAAAFALVVQMVLQRLGRRARMAAQLVGAIGLTCTAPAAYYIGTGRLTERPSFYGRPTGSSQATRFISFNCGSILPVPLPFLRNLLGGASSFWPSRSFWRLWSSHRSGVCSLPW